LIEDESVNAHIDMDNGETLDFKLVIENAVIQNVDSGEFEEPTMLLYSDEATVMDIVTAGYPTQEFISAFGDGRIRVTHMDFFKGIVFTFASFFMQIGSLFA